MSVRVRFAPSPTGHLHIGNLRTALFAWLFARHHGGRFIVRIDDTDAERSRREYEESILDDLRWLGLFWDEGIAVGGPDAPYRQSEATAIYRRATETLSAHGHLYPCYCTREELEAHRAECEANHRLPRYSGRCAGLDEAGRRVLAAEGRAASLRFRLPSREVVFRDLIRGPIRQHTDDLGGDFIVQRPDGSTLYLLASVIDDLRMRITQVIRGEEFIPTTARQILLFEALGAEPPQFAHATLILGADRQKLSKRQGAVEVRAYREIGYLPEGMLNGLSLLGWSPPEGRDFLQPADLIAQFSLERVGTAPALFDPIKMRHLNGLHLRALPPEAFEARVVPFVDADHRPVLEGSPERRRAVLAMAQTGCELLGDINRELEVLRPQSLRLEAEAQSIFTELEGQPVAQAFRQVLEAWGPIGFGDYASIVERMKATTGRKGKALFLPMRIALTGRIHGPELKTLLPLLGREAALARLDRFWAIMPS